MFFDVLATDTRNALKKLDSSPFAKETDAYLAGGTGAALLLGHRHSYDLDFFTQRQFQEKAILQLLDEVGNFKLEETAWKTIIGELEGIKFSLFYYKYPLIAPTTTVLNTIQVASLADIAAMKIAAIADRGTKRDFIDLYFMAKSFPTDKFLEFYDQKYENLSANRPHILRSLTYFEDAEADPIPEMIKPVDWSEVKNFFEGQVKKIAKDEGII